MRWERRKPLWPRVAALGLLFVLALAAPRNWQGVGSRQMRTVAKSELIKPGMPGLTKTGKLVEQPEHRLVPETVAPKSLPTLPPTASFEPLPARREFNFDTLLSLRDLLLALVDQAPAPEPTTLPMLSAQQVRVSSENDRLAMLPRRTQRNRRLAAPSLPAAVSEEEVADFAAILLEAARSSKPISVVPNAVPRLARRSSLPEPVEVSAPAEPRLTSSVPQPRPSVEPPLLRHRPQALVEQLESFSVASPGAIWSQQVLAQLRPLMNKGTAERPVATETLAQLEQLARAGISQAEQPANQAFHNQWQQAAQALDRRLVIWRLLLDPEQPKISGESQASTTLLPVLNEVAALLEEEQNGSDWREYLLLDRIAAATSEGMSSASMKRTKLAQEVLSRMVDPQLSAAQREFLATESLVQLHQELRPWAAGKVNLETLAALVERYETGREMRFALAIAQLQQRMKWSDDPRLQALAAHFDQHYRGANMRIAMSDDLLNRILPKQEPIITPVRTRIAGAKVRGRARTTTQLRLRLMPDPDAWHFGLEATGKVYSDTKSDTWPARIRNAAKMQYHGRKEISIDEQGLHVSPANAQAKGRNELLGVDSQLDPVPIFGRLLRDLARQKHSRSRPTALSQAKAKVVRTVKKRMNEGTDPKLENFEQKFREKVLAPIQRLALLAEPLDMHTTNKRAVMQLRLANTGQLAAHTLRPLAPSDSVLSLQMHETALNNAMMGLGLDGRRMTMLELFEFFSERFRRSDAVPPADMPRGAVIEFASRDAVRVRCDGDRLELVMSVTELAHRRDKIKNFEIHIHFRPVLRGLDVKLVRDGTLQFSGRRLKTGPRVVLHSVIGKVLQKDQEISILNAKFLADPRLNGLMVTQLVIEDGWIGLALGPAHPRRTAWRAPMPKVLSTPFVR